MSGARVAALALTLLAAPAWADSHPAQPVPPAQPAPQRGPVQVHRGFPIHRPPVVVWHRRPHARVWVGPPLFLPLVLWTGPVVVTPPPEAVVWKESDLLRREDDWVELNFGIPSNGARLLLELDASAELDFAEVTYVDGASQVVDLGRVDRPRGIYALADLDPRRSVEHIRLVGRATAPTARVTLRLVR